MFLYCFICMATLKIYLMLSLYSRVFHQTGFLELIVLMKCCLYCFNCTAAHFTKPDFAENYISCRNSTCRRSIKSWILGFSGAQSGTLQVNAGVCLFVAWITFFLLAKSRNLLKVESNIRHLEKMIVVDRRMGIAVPDSIYTLLDAYYEERLKLLMGWWGSGLMGIWCYDS